MESPEQIPIIQGILSKNQFYRPDHGRLFSLLESMHEAGETIDLVTVPARVARGEDDDQYGGLAHVLELPDWCPSTTNLRHYAEVIRDKAQHRDLIRAGLKLAEEGYTESAPAPQLAAQYSAKLREGMASGGLLDNFDTAGDGIREAIAHARAVQSGDSVPTISVDIPSFQAIVPTLPPGLTVVAARPKMGKTTFTMREIVWPCVTEQGRTASVYSLEISNRQLAQTMLYADTGITTHQINTGNLSESEIRVMEDYAKTYDQLPLHLCKLKGMTPEQVVSHSWATYYAQQDTDEPLGLVVVDYLGLLNITPRKGETMTSAIGRATRMLHLMGLEMGVPVVCLSQLNRSLESRENKRPRPSDLRDSGSIEQDCALLLFVYRDSVYNEEADPRDVEVIVALQRDNLGVTGTAHVRYDSRACRYLDASQVSTTNGVPVPDVTQPSGMAAPFLLSEDALDIIEGAASAEDARRLAESSRNLRPHADRIVEAWREHQQTLTSIPAESPEWSDVRR